MTNATADKVENTAVPGMPTYREELDACAKKYLTSVLLATGGDRVTAAQISDLNRTHLQALIKRYEVNVPPNFKHRGRHRGRRKARESEPGSEDETSKAAAEGEAVRF